MTRASLGLLLALRFMLAGSRLWGMDDAPPAGDAFNDPLVLAGESWTAALDNRLATREPGEPFHLSYDVQVMGPGGVEYSRSFWVTNGQSMWIRWTAPADGTVGIVLQREEDPPVIPGVSRHLMGVVVYTNATSLADLKSVKLVELNRLPQRFFSFTAVAGREYRIALDSPPETAGRFLMGLSFLNRASPANDSLETAAILSGTGPSEVFDLSRGTLETGEPGFGTFLFTFFGNRFMEVGIADRGGNSIWYEWTAPQGGAYSVNVSMPGRFPQISTFRVPRATLNPLPSLRFADLQMIWTCTNGYFPRIQWYDESTGEYRWGFLPLVGTNTLRGLVHANAGDRFVFQVDQMIGNPFRWLREPLEWGVDPPLQSAGLFFIRPSPATAPRATNDHLADAIRIQPHLKYAVDATGATTEPGEPVGPADLGLGSVWWEWTAEVSGEVGVRSTRSVEAFLAGDLSTLKPVLPNPHSVPGAGDLQFTAQKGVRYQFRTTPDDTLVSTILLVPAPANDSSNHPEPITPKFPHNVINNAPASFEPGEHRPEGNSPAAGTLWYEWTSDGNGWMTITQEGSLGMTAYRNGDPGRFDPVGSPFGSTGVTFPAEDGNSYRIALQVPVWNRATPTTRMVFRSKPTNDSFATRSVLEKLRPLHINAVFASAERGEPDHAGKPARGSIWYQFSIPSAGRHSLKAVGSGPTRLALYRGSILSTLTALGSVTVTHGVAQLPFRGSPGDVVLLAVDDLDQSGVDLSFGHQPQPDEDSPLSEHFLDELLEGSTVGATGDPADQPFLGTAERATVWYSHRVKSPGRFAVTCTPISGDPGFTTPRIQVIRLSDAMGAVLAGFSTPLADTNASVASFTSTGPELLRILVSSPLDRACTFILTLSPLPQAEDAAAKLKPSPDGRRLIVSAFPESPTDRVRRSVLRLEGSTDLVHWESLGDVMGLSTPVAVDLEPWTSGSVRFVRGRGW